MLRFWTMGETWVEWKSRIKWTNRKNTGIWQLLLVKEKICEWSLGYVTSLSVDLWAPHHLEQVIFLTGLVVPPPHTHTNTFELWNLGMHVVKKRWHKKVDLKMLSPNIERGHCWMGKGTTVTVVHESWGGCRNLSELWHVGGKGLHELSQSKRLRQQLKELACLFRQLKRSSYMLGRWNSDRSRGSDCNELMMETHQFENCWTGQMKVLTSAVKLLKIHWWLPQLCSIGLDLNIKATTGCFVEVPSKLDCFSNNLPHVLVL